MMSAHSAIGPSYLDSRSLIVGESNGPMVEHPKHFTCNCSRFKANNIEVRGSKSERETK